MDYGPALPPRLGSDLHYASDQNSNASEEPSKKASDRPKKHSHSHKWHGVEPRSASDQHHDESDDPRISSSKPKKHADKSRHRDISLNMIFRPLIYLRVNASNLLLPLQSGTRFDIPVMWRKYKS